MTLGIVYDITSSVSLDADLTDLPDSGLYLNSGVHPSITVDNLLAFLPNLDITFDTWNIATTYEKFDTTRKRADIVLYSGVIYQSILGTNLAQQPDVSPTYWIATNLNSLRIKIFIQKVKDRVFSDLRLTRRLIDNQYLYSPDTKDTTDITLQSDYAAWVFEPKGSDYTTFTINEVSLRANVATPTNLYVINQSTLVTTLILNPTNGALAFEQVNYSFSGKGKWIFAIDSQSVKSNGYVVDPLSYDGFVAYTAIGTGATPQAANYEYGTSDNGLGFNISVHLDSSQYITNNVTDFANFIRAVFELECLQMFLHNSNNRSNNNERIQLDKDMLIAETKELKAYSSAYKYEQQRKRAVLQLEKTFDREINDNNEDSITITSSSI